MFPSAYELMLLFPCCDSFLSGVPGGSRLLQGDRWAGALRDKRPGFSGGPQSEGRGGGRWEIIVNNVFRRLLLIHTKCFAAAHKRHILFKRLCLWCAIHTNYKYAFLFKGFNWILNFGNFLSCVELILKYILNGKICTWMYTSLILLHSLISSLFPYFWCVSNAFIQNIPFFYIVPLAN